MFSPHILHFMIVIIILHVKFDQVRLVTNSAYNYLFRELLGTNKGSTRIFNFVYLMTMLFGLILGSDSPSMQETCEGTLRFSGYWILTNVCFTRPTFSLPLHPSLLARVLPSKAEHSPTVSLLHPTASANRLEL